VLGAVLLDDGEPALFDELIEADALDVPALALALSPLSSFAWPSR